MGKKIVVVTTSASKMAHKDGSGEMETGAWLEEVAAPFLVFKDAGHDVKLVSVDGGAIPIDKNSLSGDFYTDAAKKMEADHKTHLENTTKLSEVDLKDLDLIFFAGGHGTCVDFATSADVKNAIETMHNANKVVALVCHAPVALNQCVAENGEPLIKGKDVTGFSNVEEEQLGLTDKVPYLLESKMTEQGGNYTNGDPWSVHTVVSGKLVTGQNPPSSEKTAKDALALLA